VSDAALARIVIDFGRRYVTIYRCDGTGVVREEEQFKLPRVFAKGEAIAFSEDAFNLLYAMVDGEANPQSARGEERASD